MEIKQYPDKFLSTSSTNFSFKTKEDAEEIADVVVALMKAYHKLPDNKVGLAAPQVGISKNMAIVLGEPMMNLEFVPAKQLETATEACFSINKAKDDFEVERPKYGWAKWVDPLTLEAYEEKINGLTARVFQHELDHINGILCNHT